MFRFYYILVISSSLSASFVIDIIHQSFCLDDLLHKLWKRLTLVGLILCFIEIPVINEIFGETYTGEEEIHFSPNEHFLDQQDGADQKRITDTNFTVFGKVPKKYHIIVYICHILLPSHSCLYHIIVLIRVQYW